MYHSSRRDQAVSTDGLMAASGLAQLQPFHYVPGVPTPFVGREREREQAAARLATQGVVTITGMAGCGKTALAAAVIQGEDGRLVSWIDLAPGLNDSIEALLWQLAQPLAEHAPLVWRALHQMHHKGRQYPPLVRLQLILEAYSKTRAPLSVCIDRIDDALEPSVSSLLIHLCSPTIRRSVPEMRVLVVGRVLPYELQQYALSPSLAGLPMEAVGQWADELALKLDNGAVRSIHDQTEGLPQAVSHLFTMLRSNPSTVNLNRLIARQEVRRFVVSVLGCLDLKDREALAHLAKKRNAKDNASLRAGFLRLEKYHIATMLPSGEIVVPQLLRDFIQYYDAQ